MVGPVTRRELDPARLGDHLDRLYRAAWAMCGSREDAEDLVQETYARVLARRRLLRGDDDLGYLLRVLRNTHVSRLRSAGRRLRPRPLSGGVEGGGGPSAAARWRRSSSGWRTAAPQGPMRRSRRARCSRRSRGCRATSATRWSPWT